MNKPNPVQQPAPDFQDDANQAQQSNATGASADKAAAPARPRSNNPGRFDNDPERARIAGRKGGENPNNAGRFDNNPERARIAGQKGGQSTQAARNSSAA